MVAVTIREAERQLEKLIARAEAGEEILITRRKHPVVRLELVTPVAMPANPDRLQDVPASTDAISSKPQRLE